MPEQVTQKDLAILCIMLILFVLVFPNSVSGGWTSLVYLLAGIIGILIPTAVATAKLGRMYPGEGGFYVWVFKALGPFWDVILVLFCGWLPPLFLISVSSPVVVSLLQSLAATFGWQWFTEEWQLVVALVLILTLIWLLGHVPLRISLRVIRLTCYCYLGVILAMGLAAIYWLATGHIPTGLGPVSFGADASHAGLFTTIVFGLLGIQFPQNLGGEIRHPETATRYLLPAISIIIAGYLLVWFAATVVLTPETPGVALSNSALGDIGALFSVVFSGPIGNMLNALATVILCAYLVVSNSVTNLLQSRLVVMMAKDRRLPAPLARLDQGVPRWANLTQMAVIVVLAVLFSIIIPAANTSPDIATIVDQLVVSAAFFLWMLSIIGLLVSAIVLVVCHGPFAERRGGPSNLFVVFTCGWGIFVGLAALVPTFAFSQSPFLELGGWVFWVSLLIAIPLAIGVIVAFFAPEPEDIKQMAILANARVEGNLERPPTETE